MFDPDIGAVREACAGAEVPRGFVLVGQGGLNLVDAGPGFGNERARLVVDGEGVVLRGGAVRVWCHGGCCKYVPQDWASVDAAAEFHGSYIVEQAAADGVTVRPPGRSSV